MSIFQSLNFLVLPNKISRVIDYNALKKATLTFKSHAMQINCTKLTELRGYDDFKMFVHLKIYFPHVTNFEIILD